MSNPFNWIDASVQLPTVSDFGFADSAADDQEVLICYKTTSGEIKVTGRKTVAEVQGLRDEPTTDELYWATPDPDGPLNAGFDPADSPYTWIDGDVQLPTNDDLGPCFGSDNDYLVICYNSTTPGTPNRGGYLYPSTSWVTSLLSQSDADKVYWATPYEFGPFNPEPPALQPGDFNLNLQVFVIHEDGAPVTYLDFPSESAAQGYIDTFGGTRNLEIVHYVKVRDDKRDNVPAGTPVLWVCQRKIGNDIIYMGNPHVAQSSADFWTSIYGGAPTYATKMLAKYPF